MEIYHLTVASQIPQDCLRGQSYGICILGQWWCSHDWLLGERAVAELIRKLLTVTKEKQRGKSSQGVLLHHDNAPAHTSAVRVLSTPVRSIRLTCAVGFPFIFAKWTVSRLCPQWLSQNEQCSSERSSTSNAITCVTCS